MTRDKAGQGIVPGFLDAAARTRLETDGKLPGGPGLFDVDRLRNMERPAEQPALPLDADDPEVCNCGGVTYHFDGCPADGQKGGRS